MKSCFAYLRVSTLKQGEQGVSLSEQRAAIQAYAIKHALKITAWFEEKETAAKQGRPVFNQVLEKLHRGEAEALIVHKIDRSARNLKDWVAVQDLLEANIDVHFASESVDLLSRGGRLSADIIAVVSADYIRNLKEEARKGFYGRLRQGFYPLPAPIGYVDRGKAQVKTIHPVLGPLVRRTFELYSTGRYSLRKLHQEMTAKGLCNKQGGVVSFTGFAKILHNPFYAGLIYIKRTNETFPGSHEPIVSMALFDRVQSVLSGKARAQKYKHEFLFRRLLTCSHCNYSLIGERQKGHVYYRCHTKECPTKGLREEVIEESLTTILQKIQLDKVDIQILEKMLFKFRAEYQCRKDNFEQASAMQLQNFTDRLNRLTDAYVDGILEKQIFKERRKDLLRQKKIVEQKQSEISSDPSIIPDRIAEILEQLKSPYSSYILGNVYEKQEILKTVTSNRTVSSKNIDIKLQLPFQVIANANNFVVGGPCRDRPRTHTTKLRKIFDKLIDIYKEPTQCP